MNIREVNILNRYRYINVGIHIILLVGGNMIAYIFKVRYKTLNPFSIYERFSAVRYTFW